MSIIVDVAGVILLVGAGVFAGRAASSILCRKSKLLTDIKLLIQNIHNGFLYRNFDVITAFNEAGKTPMQLLDLDLTQLKEISFKTDLSQRLVHSKNVNLFLNDAQRQMLREALIMIGSGSLTEECDRLKYYMDYFETQLQKATEYERRNKKLFLAMSIYLSFVVAVVLI